MASFRSTVVVVLAVAAYLFLIFGPCVVLGEDEGIYIEGALRLARGDKLYVDLFTFTGPGTFMATDLIFRVFGPSLRAARLLPALDVALLCGCIWWLGHRLGAGKLAGLGIVCFLCFSLPAPDRLFVNHRWDSAAAASLALVLGFEAGQRSSSVLALLAGAATAWAGWCTPPTLLCGLAIAGFLLASSRRSLLLFLAGGTLLSLAPTLELAGQGALIPMLKSLLLFAGKYKDANGIAYGGFPGGIGSLLNDHAGDRAGNIVMAAVNLLPAILPFLAAGIAGTYIRRRIGNTAGWFLVAAVATLPLSTYPRWDAIHLSMVSPIGYAICAAGLAGLAASARLIVTLSAAVLSTSLAVATLAGLAGRTTVATSIGELRMNPVDAALLRGLRPRIPPGRTLFVFPYFPDLYTMLGCINPTRYSFLQPGMMGPEDEADVLKSLSAHPPEWVLFYDFPPAAILRTWPSTDRARLRFPAIESYLEANCQTEAVLPHPRGVFHLRRCAGTPLPRAVGRNGPPRIAAGG